MLSLLIYIVIGVMFTVSLRRPARALVEAGRQHANLRRALRAAEEASDSPYSHLTPNLARLAEETRVLRSVADLVEELRSGTPSSGTVEVTITF